MASQAASGDPYAPFYYWDAQANNWAFDYASYNAAYGYPQQQPAPSASTVGGYPSSATAATGYYQTAPSSYAAAPNTSYGQSYSSTGAVGGPSTSRYPPAGGATSTASSSSKPAKQLPGAKDANGNPLAGSLKRGETRTTVIKAHPQGTYEDPTLLEWNPDHKRLFVGDLGNDVTDSILQQAFEKYPSFSKAKVIKRKHDQKAKGYGFVSFANPEDYLKAWKEMNGKYIGSRPCRLKAAESSIEAKDIGYRQDKMLANNVKHAEFKLKYKMGGAVGGNLRRHGVGKAWAAK